MAGAARERLQGRARPDIQSPDAFGRVKLVPGDAEQIHPQGLDVHRNLAGRLGGIGMDEGSRGVGQARDLGDGLDGADLVIGVHDGDEDGVFAQGAAQIMGGYAAMLIDGEGGYGKAERCQRAARLYHRRMLDGAGDDVTASFPQRLYHADDGQVIGLGAATGKEHLVGVASEHRGYVGPRALHRPLGGDAIAVRAAGVAKELSQAGCDGLGHLGRDGGGGVIV